MAKLWTFIVYNFAGPNESQMKYLNVYSCPTFHGKHEKFGPTNLFRSDLRAKLIKLAKKMLFYCFQFCGPQMKSGNYLNIYYCPIFYGKHEKFGRPTFFRSDLRAKLIKLAKKMLFYCFQFCGLQMKSGNYLNIHYCPIFYGKHEKFGRTHFFRSDLRAKSEKTTLNPTLSAARAFILQARVFYTQHAAAVHTKTAYQKF
jgi:hypothetical protein